MESEAEFRLGANFIQKKTISNNYNEEGGKNFRGV